MKRNNKKAKAQTIPLELLPTCQQWQSEGLHDILEGILFIYFLEHNSELAIEVSSVAWKAYQAGLNVASVSTARDTLRNDKTE